MQRVFVSQGQDNRDTLFLRNMNTTEPFFAQVDEVSDNATKVFQIRLSIWVERLINEIFEKLAEAVSKNIEQERKINE